MHKVPEIDDARQKGGDRILQAFQIICRDGPISIKRLSSMMLIPHVSAWRIATRLVDKNWIRVRYCDGLVEVSPEFELHLASARIPEIEITELDYIVKKFDNLKNVSMYFWLLERPGKITLLDSVRPDVLPPCSHSFAFGLNTTAALTVAPRREVMRSLEIYARDCAAEEKEWINSGERLKEIVSWANNKSMIHDSDPLYFSVPWVYKSGRSGSIDLCHKADSKSATREMKELRQSVLLWWKDEASVWADAVGAPVRLINERKYIPE